MANILVCDDDKDIVEAIEIYLTQEGYCILKAYDGQEALKKVKELHPDILITDIKMPVMDGITLLTRIRDQFPFTKFVITSGFSDFKYAKKAITLKVSDYLLKPVTADKGGFGCAKLVVFCNAVEDNPFMAGAFHGVGEPERVINVGVSGPGVVHHALQAVKGQPFDVVAETIKKTAFRITRMGQLVAQEASRRLDTPFGIVDLSLAPTPAVGDSVARILEEMGLEVCGTHGTTAALALLNDAVKKGGVMASSSVGGLSGAFIPVSEDAGMIRAAEAGALSLEKLEAMTCVCSVGLDMIAIPGDTSVETIFGIIADECAIGMINNKTTAVRVIPAIGKKVGDRLEFGGLLGYAPVMPVNGHAGTVFAHRGGRMPAPINSLKN